MIKYCRRCRHHLHYVKQLDETDIDAKAENGLDICGAMFRVSKDVIGREVALVSPKTKRCKACGAVTEMEGRLVYAKCERKNHDTQCSDFSPRWWLWPIYLLTRRQK